MTVEIVYNHSNSRNKQGENKTVEFSSMEEGFKFIIYNSPMNIVAIRIS